MRHVPVLVEQTLQYLLKDGSCRILDATTGCGGHTKAILDASPEVSVVALDRDREALAIAKGALTRHASRVQFVKGNYADLDTVLRGEEKLDGVLVDLGLSSLQLDESDRGFGHSVDGPLDMRMGADSGQTAKSLLEQLSVDELVAIFKSYGEVRRPVRIARAIRDAVGNDAMTTTFDLKRAVATAFRNDPPQAELSRVFQSIRIAVNNELENITTFLNGIHKHLNDDARIVIISYHSLEDRLIKTFFNRESRDCVCPVEAPVCSCGHRATLAVMTRRVVVSDDSERRTNPRSRSAKLRAARVVPRSNS